MYRWGVKIGKRARVDLGSLALSKGSSVSGFVSLAGTKLEPGKGRVTLYIESAAVSGTGLRLNRPVAESRVERNGFFQMTDVRPGRYVLQATYPGFGSGTVSPIEVYSGVEAKLRRTVELQPPIALTLHVDPAMDFKGKEWQLRVTRASPINNFFGAPNFEGQAHDGTVVLRDQEAGSYRVVVQDSAGNPFDDEEFVTAGAASEAHTFRIDAVRVKGTVHVGEQPLVAILWFGGHFGDKHTTLRSNEDGAFHGVLPRAGQWRVDVEGEHVKSELRTEVEKKDDGEATVDLRIPANHVGGIVVDSSGSPYQGATVYLANGPDSFHQRSGKDGHFVFDGVPSGSITVAADDETQAGIKSSNVYSGNVGESEAIDSITLKLTDGRSVHCRVLGHDGPVIGAEVTVRPGSGLDQAATSTATTGTDGVFDAQVAAGFERALILVAAPGYPLRVFDIAVDGHAMTLNMPQVGGALSITLPKDANGLWFFQDGRFLSVLDLFHWMRAHGDPIPSSPAFRVNDLAPGRYRACTLTPGGRSVADMTRCAEGFLPPYGELHLTIQ